MYILPDSAVSVVLLWLLNTNPTVLWVEGLVEAMNKWLKLTAITSGVGSISWLVRRGHGRATTCELYAKIIAESELLQPALNEIHKFCFQHWSRGRGTCGTGSVAPDNICSLAIQHLSDPQLIIPYRSKVPSTHQKNASTKNGNEFEMCS